jgi:predicted ribosome quality control (RQC) complex YloA/Tae2 family protein|tara:strand:+ start:3164 stop:3439 length:276 start_codon:yes stop_codon:yes gene_type:complete
MSDSQDQRLEKIEQKIDRLADAVVSIARIEERVATVLKQNDRFFIRMDKMEERVDAVENNSNLNTRSFSFVERFLWVCVSSGVGLLVYFLR